MTGPLHVEASALAAAQVRAAVAWYLRITPMAAGIADHVWETAEIVKLLDIV